ncbi:MAG: hypothetical protein AAGD11_03960 [Planctomycetota bacterium]
MDFSRLPILTLFLLLVQHASFSLAAITTDGDAVLDSEVRIAQQADGSLTVAAPSTLDDIGNVLIASQPQLQGKFTVDGTSVTTQFSQVVIGDRGNGTLEVINGATFGGFDFRGPFLEAGREVGSSGSVLVRGNGSRLMSPENTAVIGNQGFGSLVIEESGQASFGSLSIASSEIFDDQATAFGSTIVRGSGSVLELAQDLNVGSWATGELRVENGARVASGTLDRGSIVAAIGHNQFGSPNDGLSGNGLVFVDGSGSLLTHAGTLIVGGTGTGNLSISDGGSVTAGVAVLGGDATFNQFADGRGTAILDGPGSQWSVSNLVLGHFGVGQILLSNGARLTNSNSESFSGTNSGQDTVFGSQTGSFGRLVADGPTTQWIDRSEFLTIGDSGYGELVIQNGAVVSNGTVRLGQRKLLGGLARVDGEGSRWLVNNLSIGGGLSGSATVNVANGASIGAVQFLGVSAGSELALNDGFVSGFDSTGSSVANNEGTIRGDGTFALRVNNFPGGRIRVDDQQTLVFANGLVNEQMGRIDVVGGELDVREFFVNGTDGLLTLENATLRSRDSNVSSLDRLFNNGRLIVAGGENRIHGDIQNADGATITLAGNSSTTFFDRITNDGEINVTTDSSATFIGMVFGNGIAGGGSIYLEGEIVPSFGTAVMAFAGAVSFGEISQLNIEVGQDAHDFVQIAGSASIGGDLVLSALSALESDATLEILSADSVIGTFDSVPEIGEEVGFGVLFDGITYHADSIEISLLQQSGDFNDDGNVDGSDLNQWQSGYATANQATLSDGDAQRDADVDGGDFLAWQRALQSATPPAAGQSIPEPANVVLCWLAATVMASSRRPTFS